MPPDFPILLAKAQRLSEQIETAALPLLKNRFSVGDDQSLAAGTGREFWQYRRYSAGDSARLIDWRKSARFDQVYIREQEHESVARCAFVVGTHPEMTMPDSRKQEAAWSIGGALAIHALAQQQAVQWQGGGFRTGISLENLWSESPAEIDGDTTAPLLFWISDGWEEESIWRQTAETIGRLAVRKLYIRLTHPDEADFPYTGGTAFEQASTTLIFGRAEAVRSDYLAAYRHYRATQHQTAEALGWEVVNIRLDADIAQALATLE